MSRSDFGDPGRCGKVVAGKERRPNTSAEKGGDSLGERDCNESRGARTLPPS